MSVHANEILGNSIYNNVSKGIQLLNGANDNQLPQLIVVAQSGSTILNGSFVGFSGIQYRLEFFNNPVCDPDGGGAGRRNAVDRH